VASRAEPAPARTSLAGAFRAAASDLYFNSWRLLPANVIWSVVVLAMITMAMLAPPLVVLAPLAALPVAGLFRMTTRIVRGEAVSFWDAIDAWRHEVLATLGLGAALLVAIVVLGSNAITGLAAGTPLGWAFATLALWGLIATWLYAWMAWPLLADPARATRPIAERLRLAGLLVLASPGRIGWLGLLLAVFLVASAIAIVALVTVSVAFAALVAARYVLPAADRLEARLARRLEPDPQATLEPEPPSALEHGQDVAGRILEPGDRRAVLR
jgi:hypothetical protein